MAEECCQLVGDLKIDLSDCVTSINVSSSTEIIDACSPPELGPTVGNVSLSGYAADSIYVGCPIQAGVSLNWVRRYDCVNDKLYLISSGLGSAFMVGPDIETVSLLGELTSYQIINASAGSGPSSLYTEAIRRDGYGLSYSGNIMQFNTENERTHTNFGVGVGTMYLQSLNFDAQPGQVPVVSYSFIFTTSEGTS